MMIMTALPLLDERIGMIALVWAFIALVFMHIHDVTEDL